MWREAPADMPIIRHCRNCKYSGSYFRAYDDYCKVKHKRIDRGMNLRLRALFCRYYKRKGGEQE